MRYLNIGGGLGIDYHHRSIDPEDQMPSKADLIRAIAPHLPADLDFILEPGRSIMANTGVLISKVLGIKQCPDGKNFLVIDAAMNDLIRPSFYGAYHHIIPLKREQDAVSILKYPFSLFKH